MAARRRLRAGQPRERRARGLRRRHRRHRRRQGQPRRVAARQDRVLGAPRRRPDQPPGNEWLFTEAWGVDVAVSTPRVLAALVEEAVEVGDLVRLFSFREGQANLIEVTLPDGALCAGRAGPRPDLPQGRRAGRDRPRPAGDHADAGGAARAGRRAAVRRAARGRSGDPRTCDSARALGSGSFGGSRELSAGAARPPRSERRAPRCRAGSPSRPARTPASRSRCRWYRVACTTPRARNTTGAEQRRERVGAQQRAAPVPGRRVVAGRRVQELPQQPDERAAHDRETANGPA